MCGSLTYREADQSGIKVVGTPVETDEFVKRESREEHVNEEVQLLNHIPQLASLQFSWLIFYFCAVFRMNNLLRTLPPRLVKELAIEHDDRIWDTFCLLSNTPDADVWDVNLNRVTYACCRRQAKLPMRYGGLGLRDSL